jgi:predicted Zn-dependent protease
LNGANAYLGLYRGTLDNFGRVLLRAAHIENGRQVLMLAGLAPEPEFAQVDKEISGAIATFRPLSQQEANDIGPNRLAFYTVRSGDTWQSIAARHGHLTRASTLAIMNHNEVHVQPDAGARIKVVVPGR